MIILLVSVLNFAFGVYKMMLYESTRGGGKAISSAEAIKKGIADDGGLYVPGEFVPISLEDIRSMISMSYQDRA